MIFSASSSKKGSTGISVIPVNKPLSESTESVSKRSEETETFGSMIRQRASSDVVTVILQSTGE